MALQRSSLAIFFANLLIPASLIIFASGFFPHKPFLQGLAQYRDLKNPPPAAPFGKVIFMVVDALRRYLASSISVNLSDIQLAILCMGIHQAFNLLKGMSFR